MDLRLYTFMTETESGTAHSGGDDPNNYAKTGAAWVIFSWWLELGPLSTHNEHALYSCFLYNPYLIQPRMAWSLHEIVHKQPHVKICQVSEILPCTQ